jgi:hypothetical protein
MIFLARAQSSVETKVEFRKLGLFDRKPVWRPSDWAVGPEPVEIAAPLRIDPSIKVVDLQFHFSASECAVQLFNPRISWIDRKINPSQLDLRWAFVAVNDPAIARLVPCSNPEGPTGLKDIIARGGQDWTVRLELPFLVQREGRHRIVFDARAEKPRSVRIMIGQDDAPYQMYAGNTMIDLEGGWRAEHVDFSARQGEQKLKMVVNAAGDSAPFEISRVRLLPLDR